MRTYNKLIAAGLMLIIPPAFAQNTGSFTHPYFDGLTYVPDKDTKPVVVYADMGSDKKEEMVVAMQMLPIKGNGWYQTFALVYRTDGKGHQKALLKSIHLGGLLGTDAGDDDQGHVVDVMDLKNDGKKEIALWSTSGMHYHHLIIIGMRTGKVIILFNGGSDNQLKYRPRIDKYIITTGEIEKSDSGKWREEVWEWNRKKFVFSKKKSSVTVLKN